MNSSYTYVFINQQGQQQKTQLSQHTSVKSCALCRKHQKTCWSSKKPPLQKHMLPRKLCSVGVVLSQFCTFVWWICPCTHALTGQAPTQHIATSRTSRLKMWSVENAQVNLVSLVSVAKNVEKDFEAPMSLALGFCGSFGYTGMKKFTGKCWCKTFRGHTCLQPQRRSVEAVALAVGQCTLLRNLRASRSPLAFRDLPNIKLRIRFGLASASFAFQDLLDKSAAALPAPQGSGRHPACPWR